MKKLCSIIFAIGFAFVAQAIPLRFTSGGNHDDAGWAVTTNPWNGDIYVAGTIYVSAVNLNDMCLVKYNANGVFQWYRRFGRPARNDEALDVAVSPLNGEIYMTGYVRDPGTGVAAVATMSFTPNGAVIGQHFFPGNMQGDHIGQEIGFDQFGAVYVRGRAFNTGTGNDFLLIKYNPGLTGTIWVRFWDGAGGDDISNAMEVGPNGIYVVGKTTTPTGDDGVALRYSFGGLLTNTRFVTGVAGGDDEVVDLAIVPGGDLVITGTRERGPAASDTQITTMRWSANFATTTWVHNFNLFGGNSPDFAKRVKGGPMGVIVAGSSLSGGSMDIVCYQLDPATGALNWLQFFNSAASQDFAKDLAIDPAGPIYVTGVVDDQVAPKYMTMRIDGGVLTWVSTFSHAGNDIPSELALGMNVMPIVTGSSYDQVTGFDILTLRLDPITGVIL